MNWWLKKITEEFRQNKETLNIDCPPCYNCTYWTPQRHFTKTGEFEGIRCCAAEHMSRDFSCYTERISE